MKSDGREKALFRMKQIVEIRCIVAQRLDLEIGCPLSVD
jgi:hypothetical protein